MSARRVVSIAALLMAAPLPAHPQIRAPRGSPVKVERFPKAPRIFGELIAASNDSVWVLADTGLVVIPARQIQRVFVKRVPIGTQGVLVWGLIAGVTSGVLLNAACEGDPSLDCSGVFLASALVWAGFGTFWALIAGPAYKGYWSPEFNTQLRKFARFPQGLPQPFEPQSLAPVPWAAQR